MWKHVSSPQLYYTGYPLMFIKLRQYLAAESNGISLLRVVKTCGSVLDAFVLLDHFPMGRGEANFHVMSSPGRYSYGEELRPLADSI